MILPEEWVENCIEAYLYQQHTKTQLIYVLTLIVVTLCLAITPFIYIDISIQESGVIRPVVEKTDIRSSISELVDSVFVKEGDIVKKGDILLRFRTNSSDNIINYQTLLLHDNLAHLNDLQKLVKGEEPETFKSATRHQEYTLFNRQKAELQTLLSKAEKAYDRAKTLHEKELISEEEYESHYYEYQRQQNELSSLIQNQLSKWQADLNNYSNSNNEIHTQIYQEQKNKDLNIVRSPVSGTIDDFSGIYEGSAIQVGQIIATISPDSTLYAEVYVSPRNIGFIEDGMPVNIQVESFNYNEWGTLPAMVKEISSDIIVDENGNAYYRVKCELKQFSLIRKDGRKGHLKKGMSVNTHFMITRRSLFQLLYQNIDDWINPRQYEGETMLAKY